MKTYKQGISLIVLVITVIVLGILATAVILSVNNTNLIREADGKVEEYNKAQIQSALQLAQASYLSEVAGDVSKRPVTITDAIAKLNTYVPKEYEVVISETGDTTEGNVIANCTTGDYPVAITLNSKGEITIGKVGEEIILSTEVVTNYTEADIANSNGKMVAIGNTDSLDVVALFSADGKFVTITKNGENSNGMIKGSAFADNLTIESVVIKEGVTSIGMAAFFYCENLYSVTIPNGVTSIGDSAFYCCPLSSVKIPDGVTTIGSGAFSFGAMDSVTIPASVTSIGDSAFYMCSFLSTITFEGTIEQWSAVSVGSGWADTTSATEVICTDGRVAI